MNFTMAKGITKSPATYTVRISVGGKQYFLGSFATEEEATRMYTKAAEAKEVIEQNVRKLFEEHMGIRKEPKFEAPKKNRRPEVSAPSTPEPAQPVVNRRRRAEPEQPVVNRRRRAEPEPEPTPVQTTNFLPSPYNVEMNADKVANIRVFAYVAARVVVDPLDENKLYDLDQYEESFGGYVFDPEHMYWWDYEQNDYIFKTNIEEARQWA